MPIVIDGGGPSMAQKITKYAWFMRFYPAEQSAMIEAAKFDSDIQAVEKGFSYISDLEGVDPKSQGALNALMLFELKGIIAPGRADVISNTPISPEEAV